MSTLFPGVGVFLVLLSDIPCVSMTWRSMNIQGPVPSPFRRLGRWWCVTHANNVEVSSLSRNPFFVYLPHRPHPHVRGPSTTVSVGV